MLGGSDSLPQLDHVSFDGLVCRWSVCRGIRQGETVPGAVISRLNGVDPGGPDWKTHRRVKIMDEGFHPGQIVCAVCLQSSLVRIFRHDGYLFRCGGKIDASEVCTFRLLPPRKDRQVCWVINNDPNFGEDDFTVGVTHGPKTDQGMLEQRHDFA